MKKSLLAPLFFLSFAASARSVMPITPISVSGSLLGYSLNQDGLTLQVVSGGCIGQDNFEVRQLETFPVQISIVQVSQDACEAYLPYGQDVAFSYSQLGLKSGDMIRVNISKSANLTIR